MRDVWVEGPPLTIPRRNCAAATLNGKIYALGGFDGSSLLNYVEAYDPRMKSWMEVSPMLTPRSSASCTVHDGKLFVLGGTNGTRLKTAEYFDEKMNRWNSFDVDMIDTRSAGHAVTCMNSIYALGGTDNQQNIHFSMESLDQETLHWSYSKSMQVARMDFACAVISESIMAGGGQSGDILSSTEFYRPELDSWQVGPSMLTPRYGHQYLTVTL